MFNLSGSAQLPATMDGFKKTFDSKFQIPKLSARTNSNSTAVTLAASTSNTNDDGGKKEALHSSSSAPSTTFHNTNLLPSSASSAAIQCADEASKMLTDFFALSGMNSATVVPAKAQSKYSVSDIHFNKNHIYKSLSSESLPHTSGGVRKFREKNYSTHSNPSTPTSSSPFSSSTPISFAIKSTASSLLLERSISPKINHSNSAIPPPPPSSSSNSIFAPSGGGVTYPNQSMRPPSAPPVQHLETTVDAAVDFSTPTTIKTITDATNTLCGGVGSVVGQQFTNRGASKNTPPASVQVHIVKSPVASPLVITPSPRSNSSPCITDDELMDEALVGIGSK